MLTSTQQFAARFETLAALVRAVAPIVDCQAKAHCIRTIVTPAFSGAFALPDYSGLSRAECDAIAIADYDKRHALSDAYYNRDTSHWAGR